MNYSDAELRDAAAAKIQRMVLLALGKNYLRREKVCFFSCSFLERISEFARQVY